MQGALRVRAWWPTVGAVLLLLFAGQQLSSAQTMSEYQVKAAYLYNFAKFVEWPARAFENPTAPIRLCVLNYQSFESELNQMVEGKTVAGRPVAVVPVENGEQSHSCHILFVNSSQDRQVQHIIEVLRDTSVLTVGETIEFVEKGGIISFVLQDDRVRFQVNYKAANRAGLRISSRLLSVATRVIE
jgi:hypothetical protein